MIGNVVNRTEVNQETDAIPIPKVIIDQDSDPNATIVEITFGDRLGALLDTMNALKNLGLNVIKAQVYLDSSGKHNKFAITKTSTGRKVDEPELLEAIRLTIINNMLEYHPVFPIDILGTFWNFRYGVECAASYGEAFGVTPPSEKVDVGYSQHISVSMMTALSKVETTDRPGLLVDLVKIITGHKYFC
ncbi:act domain-containing protein acr11 [Phtheirospermum japonicum]|uniref:ACT domain-containing protein ACR n=1 Tax=Phtheirospermum japonicum TaxID=374723 RepID=A0A830C704_9LAMI|nr:act domain-containing protein acr11 [Phtheirospermum japonicum]